MQLVAVKQETHSSGIPHRRSEARPGSASSVIPTRPGLPALKYSRFRTLRSAWLKAVGVVVGYIDDAFIVLAINPIWN